jgi:hypothetical protein
VLEGGDDNPVGPRWPPQRRPARLSSRPSVRSRRKASTDRDRAADQTSRCTFGPRRAAVRRPTQRPDPTRLSGALRRLAPALHAAGVVVEFNIRASHLGKK